MTDKIIKAFIRVCLNQTKNIIKFATGLPLTTPSLGSMTLDEDDVDLAKEWLKNSKEWYNQEVVTKYEHKFAQWNGSKYAFAFMSGREALSACIYALGLKAEDEVILPGYTCVVVPNAFHFEGIKTVYADIELETYGLDINSVKSKITSKTCAILIQHLYGLVCRDYEALLDFARERGLRIIEDCAHSTGAEYKGVKVGNRGDVGFYSSEQSKVFNTIQGGMAVTNNKDIEQRLKEYYDKAPYPDEVWIDRQLHTLFFNYYTFKHPRRWILGDIAELRFGRKWIVSTTKEEEQGIKPSYYGRKMAAPIAVLGLNQLKKIDYYNEQRRKNARQWDKWCEDNGYNKPFVLDYSIPVFLRYPVLVEKEKKRDTRWALKDLNVQLGVWFVSNIHPVSRKIDGCINADKAVAQCVNLPTLL